MAAEAPEWVEGSEMAKKVAAKQESVVVSPEGSTTTNGSVSTGEPALSVISDTLSEEYSSDSGKGGSDTTVTPPDSINDAEQMVASWHMYNAFNYGNYTAYSKSLGAVMPNHAMIYEFEIPQHIVGRLIGRYGCCVNKIKGVTRANIIIKSHHQTDKTKICAVEGICTEIENALQMIRERFPVKRYPNLTLEQTNLQSQVIPASNISFIPNNRLSLIEGVVNDVCISCVVDLDHIFVQQPTHPSFPALSSMHQSIKGFYEENSAPELVRPFNPGVICVSKIGTGDWVRAEVVAVQEERDQVIAKLVDVGGYVQVPIDVLRQIRVDFVPIPFQATECRLANIAPINEKEGWSEEAVNFFKIICQGQILQAHVVGYCSRNGTTLINLYKPNGNTNHILINEEMVTHNYAKWVDELDQQYYYTDSVVGYADEVDQLSHHLNEWVLSPDLVSVIPTEEIVDYNNMAAAVGAAHFVPDQQETQIVTDATDFVYSAPTFTSTLSWADEMSSHDLQEEGNAEDLTVRSEDENARRKD